MDLAIRSKSEYAAYIARVRAGNESPGSLGWLVRIVDKHKLFTSRGKSADVRVFESYGRAWGRKISYWDHSHWFKTRYDAIPSSEWFWMLPVRRVSARGHWFYDYTMKEVVL